MTTNIGIEKYCKDWTRIRDTPMTNHKPETFRERSKSLKEVRSASLKYLATQSINWTWENHSHLNGIFSKMLSHPQRKWYALDLFSVARLPDALFKDMFMAGILEENPSANRGYIEICIREKGLKHVLSLLIHYIKYGKNVEKAGAIQARYWATNNPRNENVDDLKMEFKELILDEFVKNDDLSIRTNIVPFLEPEAYPSSLRTKFLGAAKIAKTHKNEYIRQRISMQMKNDDALKENGLLLTMAKPWNKS